MHGSLPSLGAMVFLIAAVTANCAAEEAPAAPPNTPPPAVDRALHFLQTDAYRWKEARHCGACHHASLPVWAFNETRARGFAVDEKILKDLGDWSLEFTKTNSAAEQPPPRDVLAFGAVYALLSVETAPPPPDKPASPEDPPLRADMDSLLQHIVKKQVADGSWGVPMDERVPLGGPVEDIAILSRIALLQSGDTSTTVTECLKNAADWLAAHHDEKSRQARNFRLLMRLREKAHPDELVPIVAAIKAEQNPDGGWSQTPEMASDAYATGQSLYVLARAGLKPDAPELKRGVEFLTRTQTENGSWAMTSRVHAKDITPITSTGTAWAVMGLARALP